MKKLLFALSLFFLIQGCTPTEEVTRTVTLDTPTNIAFDGSSLIWSRVNNADHYAVIINGNERPPVATEFYDGTDLVGETIRVEIRALRLNQIENSNVIYNNSESNVVTFRRLGRVEGLRFDNGILYWNPVIGANGYELEINRVILPQAVNEPKFEDLIPGQTYQIRVRPIGTEGFFGVFSEEITGTLIVTPVPRFSQNPNVITWDNVSGAQGYSARITLNGETVFFSNFSDGRRQIDEYDFALPGLYEVQLKSNTAQEGFVDSKFSEALEIIRLADPTTITASLVGNNDNDTAINFDPVSFATHYDIYVDGVLQQSTTNTSYIHRFASSRDETTHTIRIVARGNTNLILPSAGLITKELTKLAAPINLRLEGTLLRWDNVVRNNGYIVNINGRSFIASTNELDLDPVASGRYTVTVRTRGNDNLVVSSDFTEAFNYRKLEAPQSLEITDNVLTWSIVEGATNYMVRIGEEIVATVNNNLYQIDPIDIKESTVIIVKAIGSTEDVIDSDPSRTLEIKKLLTPRLTLNDATIVWNPIPDASKYLLTINSQEFVIEGTSFNTADLSPGDKNIRIVALGNNKEIFSSETSEIFSARKLATPILAKDNLNFEWSLVIGAQGYELRVDDQIFEHANENRIFPNEVHNYKFTEARFYEVKVRASGNNLDTISSSFSTIILHEVKTLATPSGNPLLQLIRVEDFVSISLNRFVDNANGYIFSVGGVNYGSDTGTLEIQALEPGLYNIRVRARGDNFNTIDSNLSLSTQVTLLAPPNRPRVTYQGRESDFDIYLLNWDAVQGASSYELEVIYLLADGTTRVAFANSLRAASNRSLNLLVDEDVISINVKLKSLGNNLTTYDSSEIEYNFVIEGN